VSRAGAALVVFVLGAACFSPRLTECALVCGSGDVVCPPSMSCGRDGFCHEAGENETCTLTAADASLHDGPWVDGSLGDAPLSDARLIDAPIDARAADARPDGAGMDGPAADARADGPTADANTCEICDGERSCGFVDGCSCGSCALDATWCGDSCAFAVCEENNCCFPENVPCVPGLSECCAGLTCLFLCVLP
jgi:hypothetical protein